MFLEQTPRFLRRFWPASWRIKTSTPTVYLTFDDGPTPSTTPQILEILDRYHVKATFFCVGDNVRKFPQSFQMYLDQGHQVGNHTMHHLKGFNTESERYLIDVEEADQYIHSNLLRPPYGRIKFKQLRALKNKYHIVMWDVITRDYNSKLSPEKILSIVKRYTRDGSIIVFHDSLKSIKTLKVALPQCIEFLQNEGYEIALIPKNPPISL